jgi:hypothetical protein
VIDLPLRPVGVSLLRTLLAAAAMGGALLAFGTERLSLVDWLAGGTLGVLVYLGALLFSRELSVGELRFAVTAVRRRLG